MFWNCTKLYVKIMYRMCGRYTEISYLLVEGIKTGQIQGDNKWWCIPLTKIKDIFLPILKIFVSSLGFSVYHSAENTLDTCKRREELHQMP